MRRILAILAVVVPQGAYAVSLTEEGGVERPATVEALKIPEKPASAAAVPGVDDLGAPAKEDDAEAPIDLNFSSDGGGFGADAPTFDAGAVSEIGDGDDLYLMLNKAGADDPALLRRLDGCVFDCPDAATRERVREIWRPEVKKKGHRGNR